MSNEIEIELEDDLDLQEPKKYKVFLLNDDFSTMDFVIDVLVRVFRKSVDESSPPSCFTKLPEKAAINVFL